MTKEEFVAYFNEHDGCSKTLGIRLIEIGEGEARAVLPLAEKSSNVMGGMHGGALATLADIVAGTALFYRGRACVTLDSNIRYLRGIRQGEATAHAREVHAGNRIATIQVDITDSEGVLCCTASISMYLGAEVRNEAK